MGVNIAYFPFKMFKNSHQSILKARDQVSSFKPTQLDLELLQRMCAGILQQLGWVDDLVATIKAQNTKFSDIQSFLVDNLYKLSQHPLLYSKDRDATDKDSSGEDTPTVNPPGKSCDHAP